MPECTPRQQRVLKTGPLLAVHRFGGAVSLLMPYFVKSGVNDGGEPVGFNAAGHWPGTEVMVIPGAFGYLPTGVCMPRSPRPFPPLEHFQMDSHRGHDSLRHDLPRPVGTENA